MFISTIIPFSVSLSLSCKGDDDPHDDDESKVTVVVSPRWSRVCVYCLFVFSEELH